MEIFRLQEIIRCSKHSNKIDIFCQAMSDNGKPPAEVQKKREIFYGNYLEETTLTELEAQTEVIGDINSPLSEILRILHISRCIRSTQ